MDSHAVAQFLKPALTLIQDAAQSAAQATPQATPQIAATQVDRLARWQAYAFFVQTLAFIIQAGAAIYIIRATRTAAREGAERAYELGEQSARRREEEESAREQARLKEHSDALRLLVTLELGSNSEELDEFHRRLLNSVGGEVGMSYTPEGSVVSAARLLDWLKPRQLFVARYMPLWSHHAWYGQQTSHLLPRALNASEIGIVSNFHSQLARLTQVSGFLAEQTRRLEEEVDAVAGHDDCPLPSASAVTDALDLWEQFASVLRRARAALGNTVLGALPESGSDRTGDGDGSPVPAPTFARGADDDLRAR